MIAHSNYQAIEIRSKLKIARQDSNFERFLLPEIRKKRKLTAVTGMRGTGKTTLLLQLAGNAPSDTQPLYISLDEIMLAGTSLFDIAEHFYQLGGKFLLLDEVHKYPSWSPQLKLIYDSLHNLNVVFTGSSALEVFKGQADLSRRAVLRQLPGMSLREFIELKYSIRLQPISLNDIFAHHEEIASFILKKIKPLRVMKQFMEYGVYPFFTEDTETYHERLRQSLLQVLESDLPAIAAIDYSASVKLKILLEIIAESVPFKPNIVKISERIGISRDSLYKYLDLLGNARIINNLSTHVKGIGKLAKPDKIYLENTNLMYCLGKNSPERGNMRETFFLSQVNYLHNVSVSPQSDFLIDDKWTIEVGGKTKNGKQIKDITNSYIASDDIEIGSRNTIPLYLFGLLY